MLAEYAEQISEDAFYYEQPERTTDIPLPAGMGFLFPATSAAAFGSHPAVTVFESHLAAAGT